MVRSPFSQAQLFACTRAAPACQGTETLAHLPLRRNCGSRHDLGFERMPREARVEVGPAGDAPPASTTASTFALLTCYIRFSLYYVEGMVSNLDTAFAALADPTRRAIVARLTAGEANITELSKPFELSQPAMSRHIKVLQRAGLIERRAAGTHRLCRLRSDAFAELEHWLATLRQALEANYSRLEALLAEGSIDTARRERKST